MTLTSDSALSSSEERIQFRKVCQIVDQIINILNEFQGKYHKKFNFSKLIHLLNIPESESFELLNLIFRFQDLFETVFKQYQIRSRREGNTTYLITKRKDEYLTPVRIQLSNRHTKFFNDLIYTFKSINRGKGFDIANTNDVEFLNNLEHLRSEHPYLFQSNGNGLIYPSKIGLDLGNLIISYNKSNQKVDTFKIQNYIFKVVNENE